MPFLPKRVNGRSAWTHAQPVQRIRGGKLQRLRHELFASQPLCQLCLTEGRITVATIRDHIRPIAEGGTDELTNIQAVCSSCHARKIGQESARGRIRNNG